jgi:hypothetical protein
MIKSANGLNSHRSEIKMNQKFIVIDGKTYKSVDEMPEEVRQKYENAMRALDKNQDGTPDMLENTNLFADKNQNGMPDALEGLASIKGLSTKVTTRTKFTINGQTYDNLDQLPPELRAKYEQAMSAMDANHNGVPDFLEGMLNVPDQRTNQAATNFGTASPTPFPVSRNPTPVGSTIEPESSGGWMVALSGILLIGLCLVAAGAGIWYFFLR